MNGSISASLNRVVMWRNGNAPSHATMRHNVLNQDFVQVSFCADYSFSLSTEALS